VVGSCKHVSMRRWMRALSFASAAGLLLISSGCDAKPGVVSGEFRLQSRAGSLVVQCIDKDMAKLVSWHPKSGYEARVIVQGPTGEASLMFTSATANDVRVAVHCVDSKARLEEFDQESP
jgi:hypothetical protein